MIKRIKSGIPGLDKLIQGGFIKGSTTLLTGPTGTGKTIFCAQFIHTGLKKGERCLFITLEERPEDIIADVENFKWDFGKWIKKGKLFIEYKDAFQASNIVELITEEIKKKKIQRVVIDSTSLFGLYFKDPFEVRKQLFKLITGLKETGATTLLTAEIEEGSPALSRFGMEEFVTDAVIRFSYLGKRATPYAISIRKMRRTDYEEGTYPMTIKKKKGIFIKK